MEDKGVQYSGGTILANLCLQQKQSMSEIPDCIRAN